MDRSAAARPGKTKAAANSLIVTVAVTAGIVLLNVAGGRVRTRYDVTSGGLYSLTPASRHMVADLKETVHATAYFGHVPADQYYMQEFVETLLDEYAKASGGKFEWKKIDPFERGRDFMKKIEDEDGIQKIFLLTQVNDAPKQEPVYFHVQFSYLDKKQLWAPRGNFSLTGIEYTFSSLIRQVAFPKKKVAISQGSGEPEQAQAITAILGDLYDVSPADLSKPDVNLSSYDVVIVNGPTRPIPQAGIMAIDKHVMAGKPVLFLEKGMSWQSGGNPNMPPEMQGEQPYVGSPADDGLGPLLAHYGIEPGRDVIIDGRNATTGVIPMGREPLLTKAFFPLVAVDPAAADILPRLDLVALPFASSLELTGPLAGGSTDAVKVIPLLASSPASFRRDEILPVTRETSLQPKAGEHGPYPTGYALEGSFTSLLAGDTPAAAPGSGSGSDAAAAALTSSPQQSPGKTRLVVLGSSDFISDVYIGLSQRHPLFQIFGAGRLVLSDLIDWLAQDQALIAARSKEAPRPIEPIARSDRLLLQYGNLAGAPLLLCLIGIIWWRIRERRRKHITL